MDNGEKTNKKKKKKNMMMMMMMDMGTLALIRQLEEEDRIQEKRNRLRRKEQEENDFLIASMLHQEQQEQQEEQQLTIASTKKEKIVESLAPCQQAALRHVQRVARCAHEEAMPRLLTRVAQLGSSGGSGSGSGGKYYNKDDVERCLDYIRDDVPIIIHLKERTLELLVKDHWYRNLFETNVSGGSSCKLGRQLWERNLFGTSYDNVDGSFRPKYGCLNITGDIEGVAPARSYGPLYIVLASHVRYRATFSDRDTGGASTSTIELATNEYYAHVLERYCDSDLLATLQVSRIRGSPSRCSTYKEVQIHGPISLATDIQALSVPGSQQTATCQFKHLVQTFQKQTGCNILWQQDLLSGT